MTEEKKPRRDKRRNVLDDLPIDVYSKLLYN